MSTEAWQSVARGFVSPEIAMQNGGTFQNGVVHPDIAIQMCPAGAAHLDRDIYGRLVNPVTLNRASADCNTGHPRGHKYIIELESMHRQYGHINHPENFTGADTMDVYRHNMVTGLYDPNVVTPFAGHAASDPPVQAYSSPAPSTATTMSNWYGGSTTGSEFNNVSRY